MTSLNRFTPAAAYGDKFFGMSAKERVIAMPANSLSGGYTVPDRERAGTKHVSMLADDGGLPQATQTQQDSATATTTAPEGSPQSAAPADAAPVTVAQASTTPDASVIAAPSTQTMALGFGLVIAGLWWLNKR